MTQDVALGRTIPLFFRAVDRRDWAAVAGGLADEVTVDYTSVFGGVVETLPGHGLVARWQGMLPGFDATQHFLGPPVATDPGVVECNVRGYHHLEGEVWMVAGWYRLVMQDGDRIGGITLTTTYETGDRALVEKARARAAS
jgi:SnoaL-like domain